MRIACSLALVAALLGGCAIDGDITDDPASPPGTIDVNLNGPQLNGIRLNGIRLNGIRLNGIRLNGIRLNGTLLSGTSLHGSELTGYDGTTELTGAMMIGSQLDGTLADGSTVTLEIDDAHTLAAPDQDVWSYRVSFLDSDQWFPACGVGADGAPIEAIAVGGLWDYREGVAGGGSKIADSTRFTLACRGIGAIAKCVEMGYKPWLPTTAKQSCGTTCTRTTTCRGNKCSTTTTCAPACATVQANFADYHQACTRMVRADYCGDGSSYTKDGTAIDVYDGIGVQLDTAAWSVEAEWVPSGARCYSGDLLLGLVGSRLALQPTCTDLDQPSYPLASGGCGDPAHFVSGAALLIDEARATKNGSGN